MNTILPILEQIIWIIPKNMYKGYFQIFISFTIKTKASQTRRTVFQEQINSLPSIVNYYQLILLLLYIDQIRVQNFEILPRNCQQNKILQYYLKYLFFMDPYLQTSSSIPISQKQAQELVIKFKSIFYKCKNSKFRQLFKEKTLKQETLSPYLQAKISQTEQRDLRKALNCYIKAAVCGEKVNTCIKDFASVLHQCGYTEEAIKFLKQMQKYYSGNKQRYSKLVENLKIQLKPSGKHSLKKILIDTKDYFFTDLDIFLSQMFQNKKRIKQVQYYHNLSLRKQQFSGSYLLLIFQSFSAAKKTLQTYKNDPGLQFDKYWIDCSSLVACKAIDGKEQFQQSLFFKKGILNKMHGVQITQEAQRQALKLMEQTIENTRKKGGQEDDHFYRNKYIIESIKYYDANYHKEGQQYKNYLEQQQLSDPYQ